MIRRASKKTEKDIKQKDDSWTLVSRFAGGMGAARALAVAAILLLVEPVRRMCIPKVRDVIRHCLSPHVRVDGRKAVHGKCSIVDAVYRKASSPS